MTPRRPSDLVAVSAPRAFAVVLGLYVAIAVPYLAWRVTLVDPMAPLSVAVYAAEVLGATLTGLFLWMTRVIELPRHRPAHLRGRSVDVLIPTYNEQRDVLEPVVAGARAVRGVRDVWVLDDGARDWVRALAVAHGARWLPRHTNEHAKAGNLNQGLGVSDADLLVLLDADHVPVPELVERTLCHFDDPGLAFVQAPQRYHNTDSFLFRRTRRGTWAEQDMFYDVIQPAKNRFNAAFFVGTTAVMRRAALDSIGGFATGTATEDIHTSLRLHAAGWRSLFVAESLAHGLEADSLREYFRQRRRGAAGSLGLLVRSRDSPLRARGLTAVQRLNYLSACLAHLMGLQKLGLLLVPVLCVTTMTPPVHGAGAEAVAAIAAFAVLSIAATAMFARGTYHVVHSEACNLAHFLAHGAGLWGVVRVQRKFSVSRKLVGAGERTPLVLWWWALAAVCALAGAWAIRLLVDAGRLSTEEVALLAVSLALLAANAALVVVFLAPLARGWARPAVAPAPAPAPVGGPLAADTGRARAPIAVSGAA